MITRVDIYDDFKPFFKANPNGAGARLSRCQGLDEKTQCPDLEDPRPHSLSHQPGLNQQPLTSASVTSFLLVHALPDQLAALLDGRQQPAANACDHHQLDALAAW